MAVTKNNYVRLKEEADIETVISYLQIPVTKKGCNYFIPCPNPDHADKHATNCYFKKIYCIRVFTIIAHNLRELVKIK